MDIERRHALAALALYGQPFGFTPEDADFLDRLWDYAWDRVIGREGELRAEREQSHKDNIVARIRALLPPRATPTEEGNDA